MSHITHYDSCGCAEKRIAELEHCYKLMTEHSEKQAERVNELLSKISFLANSEIEAQSQNLTLYQENARLREIALKAYRWILGHHEMPGYSELLLELREVTRQDCHPTERSTSGVTTLGALHPDNATVTTATVHAVQPRQCACTKEAPCLFHMGDKAFAALAAEQSAQECVPLSEKTCAAIDEYIAKHPEEKASEPAANEHERCCGDGSDE